jgi:hypothetical protein
VRETCVEHHQNPRRLGRSVLPAAIPDPFLRVRGKNHRSDGLMSFYSSFVLYGFPFRRLYGFTGCGKTHRHCHPEEVAAATDEESLCLLESSNAGVLRCAQDDSAGAFYRKLFITRERDPQYQERGLRRHSLGGKAVDLYTLSNAHGMEDSGDDVWRGDRFPGRSRPEGAKRGRGAGLRASGWLSRQKPLFRRHCGTLREPHQEWPSSRSTARSTRWARTTRPTPCTAGSKGFDKALWQAQPFEHKDEVGLTLQYTSPDGEEGYPGTLHATVTYTLNDLKTNSGIHYQATTDKATPITLASHSAFNLAGEGSGDILGHVLMLNAAQYTPFDSTPHSHRRRLSRVKGTPLDFTHAHGGGFADPRRRTTSWRTGTATTAIL